MENNKKQTAVEWLADQLECFGNKHELQMSWTTLDELFEQAKEMDKQQKIEDYRSGRTDQQSDKTSKSYNRRAADYYKETYETSH
jgi:hypothetical protein